MKLIFIFLLVFSFEVFAKKDLRPVPKNEKAIEALKKQGRVLLSTRAADYISRAEALLRSGKNKRAIETLEFHLKRKEIFTETERAHFLFHLYQFYRADGDIKTTIKYINQVLDSKALDYHKHLNALYSLAQIYVEKEDLKKGYQTLKTWFSLSENPRPQGYVLTAYIHHSRGELKKALKYVEYGISLSSRPRENWLDFCFFHLHPTKKL